MHTNSGPEGSTKYLTADTVASRLGVSRDTIRRLVRQRRLGAVNISSPARPIYRFTEADVTAFLASGRLSPAVPA